MPVLVTSRPEGVRKRLFARDFVILDLEPLTTDQQHEIIAAQLAEHPACAQLLALSAEPDQRPLPTTTARDWSW